MEGTESGYEYKGMRLGQQVTVTFDKLDPVSILRALREVVSPEVLRIVAHAELSR